MYSWRTIHYEAEANDRSEKRLAPTVAIGIMLSELK
jgi:hypothetical protein